MGEGPSTKPASKLADLFKSLKICHKGLFLSFATVKHTLVRIMMSRYVFRLAGKMKPASYFPGYIENT